MAIDPKHLYKTPMRIAVSSTTRTLLAGGTVLSFGGDSTTLQLFVDDDTAYVLFEFFSDVGEVRFEITNEGTSTIKVKIFNLRSNVAFSEGPIPLGILGNMRLWLLFEVGWSLGTDNNVKRITYSFYVAPPGEDSAIG